MKLSLPFGQVDPFNLKPEDVRLGDIIHSTSLQCRFNGYVRKHYSVAQHMLLCCALAEFDYSPLSNIPQAALLHDAVETYIGDIVLPVKEKLPGYQELEDAVDRVVWKALGLVDTPRIRKEVRDYDRAACRLELEHLLFYRSSELEDWPQPPLAYRQLAEPLLHPTSPEKVRRLYAKKLQSFGFQV